MIDDDIPETDYLMIERSLSLLMEPGSTFEIRCPETSRGVVSGYFNDVQAACVAAFKWSGQADAVCVTLNPVLPDLRARASNRAREFTKSGGTTTDEHILRRRWWLVDCDPERPKGISATSAEKRAAREVALSIREWLSGLGFPLPILADSGNGSHLLYRVELPNDETTKDLLSSCLKALAKQFNSERVTVDVSTYNASRLVKLYGTLACKGDHCPDLGRVHRLSRLVEVPDPIATVDFGGLA